MLRKHFLYLAIAPFLLTACAKIPKLDLDVWPLDQPELPPRTTLIEDVSTNGAIGGLAWLDETTLLIARDTKNYDGVTFADLEKDSFAQLPLAMARTTGAGLAVSPVRLTVDENPALKHELAPSDIEAICLPQGAKMTDGKFTIIAAESHRTLYERPDPGQLFLMEVSMDAQGWHARVKGAVTLPNDYDLGGAVRQMDNIQVEGIACRKQLAGGYSILIGYRGQHSLPPTPSDYVGQLALFRDVSFAATGESPRQLPDLSEVIVDVRPLGRAVMPGCVGKKGYEDGEWRDISDLFVTRQGDILTASSYEGNETEGQAPFCSTLYKTGYHLDFDGRGWRLDGESAPMRLRELSDVKVEALAPEKPGSRHLILGYDNEDLGSGIITP
ncbi:MAG: hypothetical protein EP340_04650 [Alphaproteobacteria bacterium]|nr:MAG: hypothetical protein EP340_04650 [Alphaproteobacteria bacterium]